MYDLLMLSIGGLGWGPISARPGGGRTTPPARSRRRSGFAGRRSGGRGRRPAQATQGTTRTRPGETIAQAVPDLRMLFCRIRAAACFEGLHQCSQGFFVWSAPAVLDSIQGGGSVLPMD